MPEIPVAVAAVALWVLIYHMSYMMLLEQEAKMGIKL